MQFKTTLVGVTYENRQQHIKKLKSGQSLQLRREPDNPHDRWAVAVYDGAGNHLGYLPAGDRQLAIHMDMTGRTDATVFKRTGGPGVLGHIFSSMRKNYGCVVNIIKGDYDYSKSRDFTETDFAIRDIGRKAAAAEKSEPERALKDYREMADAIIELDSNGIVAKAWRRERYPINRISLLLVKLGRHQEALDEILKYENWGDYSGLLKADEEAVSKRKAKLIEKYG